MDKKDFFALNDLLNSILKNTRFAKLVHYSGSCVRDMYLKRDIKDIELTAISPLGALVVGNFITSKCGAYQPGKNPLIDADKGYCEFTLGKKYPQFKNVVFHVYTARKDPKYNEDGITKFKSLGNLKEDAHLKDFTINSLYMQVDEKLKYTDYTGMIFNDLKGKLVRTTIDPDMSFEEDPLRMLRAIRIASELGFNIEKYTWFGICKNARSIFNVPDERIRTELNKILISPHADVALRRMQNSGLLSYVLPEIKDLVGIEQGKQHCDDVFEHSLKVMMKMKPTIAYRLAGLYHDIGKSVTQSKDFYGRIHFKKHESMGSDLAKITLGVLGYPQNIIDDVTKAINLHMRFKDNGNTPSKHSVRKFMREAAKGDIDLCLDLIDADNNSHAKDYCKPDQVKTIRKMIEKLEEKDEKENIKLPVNGKDIMKSFGIGKGPRVGKAIDLLKECYHICPKMTRDEALSLISDAIKRKQI